MNKNYRIVWSYSRGSYVVASELARGKIKSSVSTTAKKVISSAIIASVLTTHVAPVFAAPVYGEHASGAGNRFDVSDKDIVTSGAAEHGLFVEKGASGSSNNVNVTTTGERAAGIYADGKGSSFVGKGGIVNVVASNSYGISAAENAEMTLDGIQVTSKRYGLYSNTSIINATNMKINSATSAVVAEKNGATINISNSELSAGGAHGGAVYSTSSGAKVNVTDSKLISTGLFSSGVISGQSGYIFADNVEINIAQSGYGARTIMNGKLDITNSLIKSDTGGIAVSAEAGGIINIEKLQVEIDNPSISNKESIAISTGNFQLNKSESTVNVKDSSFNITGNKGVGINSSVIKSNIDLENSSIDVENGPAVRADKGASTTINLNNSQLSGKTLLEAGKVINTDDDVRNIVLNASNRSQLFGDIHIDRNATLNSGLALNSNSTWRGAAHGLHTFELADNSRWDITGDSTVERLNAKDSVLAFDHSDGSFKTLTINGDYHGDNTTLIMNLALADDSSATDKLHVMGNSSGTTKVQVRNAGGKGSATLEGIELINVDGIQSGEFKQDGRIVAGAWDYSLEQDAMGNWRLASDPIAIDPVPITPADPADPADPFEPGDPGRGDGGDIVKPEIPQPKRTPRTRPEVGSYIANMAAANTMFIFSAADRPGITEYRNAMTGKTEKTTLWLRNNVAHGRFNDSTDQLKSTTNIYMTQLGGDVAQWSLSGRDRFSLGVMAGYGNAKSNTRSKVTGYGAKGQVNGYSAGIYAGWQQNSVVKTGAYADSWLAYNTFNNSVKGEGIGQESYTSKGLVGSLEAGYTWAFGEQQQFSVQPKAQAVWMGVHTSDYTEQNGTRVRASGNHNVQTRTGLRASMKTVRAEPYVEVNWLHNTQKYGSQLDGVEIEQAGARNMGEVKLGLNAQVQERVGLWGSVTQQMGGKGLRGSSASLGVKVSF